MATCGHFVISFLLRFTKLKHNIPFLSTTPYRRAVVAVDGIGLGFLWPAEPSYQWYFKMIPSTSRASSSSSPQWSFVLFIYLLLFPFDCCGACNSQNRIYYSTVVCCVAVAPHKLLHYQFPLQYSLSFPGSSSSSSGAQKSLRDIAGGEGCRRQMKLKICTEVESSRPI